MNEDLDFRIETMCSGTPAHNWFCVRTHHKHEMAAASHLRQEPTIEVFLPRIRYKCLVNSRPVWRTEALFQNYFFARFDLNAHLRRVQHSPAVRGVVRFGRHWPIIQPEVIESLRCSLGPGDLRVVADEPGIDEAVVVAGGPLNGLEAVVTKVKSSAKRVEILLDFLGRQIPVELSREHLVKRNMSLDPALAA